MIHNPILCLAIVFILSFFFARLAKKLKVPTITAYVLLGILFSPDISNLISKELLNSADFFSNIALGMIAFALGESFSGTQLLRPQSFGQNIVTENSYGKKLCCEKSKPNESLGPKINVPRNFVPKNYYGHNLWGTKSEPNESLRPKITVTKNFGAQFFDGKKL